MALYEPVTAIVKQLPLNIPQIVLFTPRACALFVLFLQPQSYWGKSLT